MLRDKPLSKTDLGKGTPSGKVRAKTPHVVQETCGGASVSQSGKQGVVDFCLHESREGYTQGFTTGDVIRKLKAGLPVKEVDDLRRSLDLPMERLGAMLGISKATWHRRQQAGKLEPAESDRVVRYARLMGRAIAVLESEENARKWLNSPQVGLSGAVPLEYAETEVGCREVENLLGRIEYGVYS
jgi:putative toxin-antitoxin system antitoxin component (TIGR02293 family)